MNGPPIKALGQLIDQRIAELEAMAEGSQALAAVVELDQTRQGRLSRMDAMQGQAMAQASEQRRVAQVRRLRHARARLNDGRYGECADCGEWIATARLQADPATLYCRDCASARERV